MAALANQVQRQQSTGINLVSAEMKKPDLGGKIKNVLKRTSFIFLGIYILALGVIGAMNFIFGRQLSQVKTTRENLVRDIEGMKATESSYQVVKSRSKLAGDMLDQSPQSPYRLITDATRNLPANVEVSEATADNGKLILTLTTPDSAVLKQIFERITSGQYAYIQLESLSLSTKGVYSVSFALK